MALPFLSATEDLSKFASVSTACRDAARDSYRRRIYHDTTPHFSGQKSPRLGQPKIFPANDKVQEPWWAQKQRKREAWMLGENHLPLTFREDGSWSLEEDDWGNTITPPQWLTDLKLIFPAQYYELFNNDDTELVHWSITIDRLLLVILCRWTDRGEENEFNTEETRKQLFAVLYKLPESSKSPKPDSQLSPLFCQELTEPMDRNNYGSLDNIYFGNGETSRNGKVVALITALPLGNEDNVDDIDPRETAEITVFDITIKALIKRNVIEVPIGDRTGNSMLTMTISNGGELLSVNTTQDESDSVYGDWEIYNVATTTALPLVKREEIENYFLRHLFTPDNEILIILPDHVDAKAFFEQSEIPAWLAQRMIVAQTNGLHLDAHDDEDE